tara:strand:- start:45 stop:479 length:435 start_codon:yes stop_codon:yes gene_type:complete
MAAVYELTFFLALGLLAITITVFVLAVSQRGKPIESAPQQQQEILSRQTITKKGQIQRIEGQLEQAKKVGQIDEPELLKELQQTKDKIDGYDAELRHIQQRISLILRKATVIYPGASFIAALSLSMVTTGLVEAQNLLTLAFRL